jgi:hypothetical protein
MGLTAVSTCFALDDSLASDNEILFVNSAVLASFLFSQHSTF